MKIDRRFVQGIGEAPGDADIAGAIIAMAHRLGLSVVGEGIETSGQLSFLHSNGCDLGQGFLLGRPQSFDPGWLRRDASGLLSPRAGGVSLGAAFTRRRE